MSFASPFAGAQAQAEAVGANGWATIDPALRELGRAEIEAKAELKTTASVLEMWPASKLEPSTRTSTPLRGGAD
jgi:hypothetical protein